MLYLTQINCWVNQLAFGIFRISDLNCSLSNPLCSFLSSTRFRTEWKVWPNYLFYVCKKREICYVGPTNTRNVDDPACFQNYIRLILKLVSINSFYCWENEQKSAGQFVNNLFIRFPFDVIQFNVSNWLKKYTFAFDVFRIGPSFNVYHGS